MLKDDVKTKNLIFIYLYTNKEPGILFIIVNGLLWLV